MLGYLGVGARDYHARPCSVQARPSWELQAIVGGRAAPVIPGLRLPPQGRRLWVFPPTTRHGWTAPADQGCEVVVLHFPDVPDPLRSHCLARGWHAAPLGEAACARLIAFGRELDRDRANPNDRSHILHQQALAEVSLLALANVPPRRLPDPQALAQQRVQQALAWYVEHLEHAPGIAEAAAAVRVSPSHLRRLCLRVLGVGPQRAFDDLRYQRARDLLRDPGARVETVAQACGFSCASALSRGFRAHCGHAPREWRRRQGSWTR